MEMFEVFMMPCLTGFAVVSRCLFVLLVEQRYVFHSFPNPKCLSITRMSFKHIN